MITYENESFIERLEELKQLLPYHWEELALNKDKVPLDPQYEVYFERELRGELLFTTAREYGMLVGYHIAFIAPGLHYKTCLTCTTDIFYIYPEFRKSAAGTELFKFVEKELIRRGVQRWFTGSKKHFNVGKFFDSLGFEEVETYHSKWLGG